MDGSAGPTVEHSDSDSGESWILLESDRAPSHADDAPESPEDNVNIEKNLTDHVDKDEDTDGISIISDSEPESITHCEWSSEKSLIEREVRPTEQQLNQYVSDDPLHNNNDEPFESMKREDDFLGDNIKLKTYVHHRNKRLSTVLNIIVLGSVITAAGVAIGHMWGMRDDCSMHSVPSVNKILSNLYKLQEENTYLRNIVRELTQNINSNKIQKQDSNELPQKPYRCKKVFEEPLSSNNVKITKCVDNNNNFDQAIEKHLKEPEYEKDFLIDINKLKHVYKENRSWLDKETIKRLKNEEKFIGKKNIWKHNKFNKVNQKKDNIDLDQNVKKANVGLKLLATPGPDPHGYVFRNTKELNNFAFAESLRKQHREQYKRDEMNDKKNEKVKEHVHKMKPKKEKDSILENSVSENEFKKDDRHTKHKQKPDRKKQDRQKLPKKQKRRNKYEQWEMKGGYLKDYDEILSVSSSQDSDYVLSNADKQMYQDNFNDEIDKLSETDDTIKSTENLEKKSSRHVINNTGKGVINKDLNDWYEKRVNLRTEARKKLEHELFGENTTNSAGWYFRRMHRREQCRAKRDNTTQKKISRRNMNFKMKH